MPLQLLVPSSFTASVIALTPVLALTICVRRARKKKSPRCCVTPMELPRLPTPLPRPSADSYDVLHLARHPAVLSAAADTILTHGPLPTTQLTPRCRSMWTPGISWQFHHTCAAGGPSGLPLCSLSSPLTPRTAKTAVLLCTQACRLQRPVSCNFFPAQATSPRRTPNPQAVIHVGTPDPATHQGLRLSRAQAYSAEDAVAAVRMAAELRRMGVRVWVWCPVVDHFTHLVVNTVPLMTLPREVQVILDETLSFPWMASPALKRPLFVVGSLEHLVPVMGGFVVGPDRRAADRQRLQAHGYVFSASLPPHLAAAATAAVIEAKRANPDEQEMQEALHALVE